MTSTSKISFVEVLAVLRCVVNNPFGVGAICRAEIGCDEASDIGGVEDIVKAVPGVVKTFAVEPWNGVASAIDVGNT